MAEAAAIGRSYFVAWQTVINVMELMPGQTRGRCTATQRDKVT